VVRAAPVKPAYADVSAIEFQRLSRIGSIVISVTATAVLGTLAYFDFPLRWLIVVGAAEIILCAAGIVRDAALWLDARERLRLIGVEERLTAYIEWRANLRDE
jgi:hypothetical protein